MKRGSLRRGRGKTLKLLKYRRSSLPRDIASALAHRGRPSPAASLNGEAIAFGWLYQHASNRARLALFDAIRKNGCDCLRCEGGRARWTGQLSKLRDRGQQ